MDLNNNLPSQAICFGLNRTMDEQSLKAFIQRFSRDSVLSALVPRLEDREITELLDTLSDLMRKHLSEQEYHRLFLSER